jgi:hypothetical protein
MSRNPDRHPAWSFWWPALVAFSIVPITLLATGVISWLEVVGIVLLVVFMGLVMVVVVVPLWRSALRDLGRWTRRPPHEE